MAVLLDIQGVQSQVLGERGIARYLSELASALEREHPETGLPLLLNPDLPVPAAIDSIPSWRLEFNDRVDLADASVYHVGSPFETRPDRPDLAGGGEPVGLPHRGHLYDLIPEIFSDAYLAIRWPASAITRGSRRLRRADRFLAISEATREGRDRACSGFRPERIRVVGAAASGNFVRPPSREAALATLAEQEPWVRPGYVLCTGGIDYRKNIDRLLVAYAALPAGPPGASSAGDRVPGPPGRARSARAAIRRARHRGRRPPRRVRPGRVLVLFYQAAGLVVYPSLYEGYGLPVAEAISCGAPVLTGRTSSLVELVEDEAALFDPTDARSIRQALERALTDDEVLARLSALKLASGTPGPRWRAARRRPTRSSSA